MIYPKSKDGGSVYNPSGKYNVKLYWLGAYRKITVDDRIPVDNQNRPLLVCSPCSTELWPLLVCKALVKLAAQSYRNYEGSELGDFDVLHALRGFIPERFMIDSEKKLFKLFSKLFGKVFTPNLHTARLNKDIKKISSPNLLAEKPERGEKRVSKEDFRLFAKKNADLNTGASPIIYRILDVKILQEEGSDPSMILKLRIYLSSGIKKIIKDKEDAHDFFDDIWIKLGEFCENFHQFTIYHFPTTFKTSKSIFQIIDPQKPVESFRIPSILAIPEDRETSQSVLLFFQTYGRFKSPTNSGSHSVILEEYDWKSIAFKKSIARISSNGCAAVFTKLKPGQSYKFSIDCSSSCCVTILSRDDFYFEDEAKYLLEKHQIKCREFEDSSPAQQQGSWCTLFKYHYGL